MEYQVIYIVIILAGFVIGKYPKDKLSKVTLLWITLALFILIIPSYWTITIGKTSLLAGIILLLIHSFKIQQNSLIYILGITIPIIIHLIFTLQNYPYVSSTRYTQIISIIFWILIIIQDKKRSNPNFSALTMISFWAFLELILGPQNYVLKAF